MLSLRPYVSFNFLNIAFLFFSCFFSKLLEVHRHIYLLSWTHAYYHYYWYFNYFACLLFSSQFGWATLPFGIEVVLLVLSLRAILTKMAFDKFSFTSFFFLIWIFTLRILSELFGNLGINLWKREKSILMS